MSGAVFWRELVGYRECNSGRELWAPKVPETSKQKNPRRIQSEPGNGQF